MNIFISNSGDMPIYEQITSQIKDMIMRGELKGGGRPSLDEGSGKEFTYQRNYNKEGL